MNLSSKDILDSRDVDTEIDDLADTLRSALRGLTDEELHEIDVDSLDADELVDQWEAGLERGNQLCTDAEPDAEDLVLLTEFRRDVQCDSSEWESGIALINESYFTDYAQELASDIGAVDLNASWPLNHIDWDAAADSLRDDYVEADLDGVTFWFRPG